MNLKLSAFIIIIIAAIFLMPIVSAGCTETDNSQDFFLKGTTTDCNWLWCTSYPDDCTTSTQLKEYYCIDKEEAFVLHDCYYGCSNGACIIQAPTGLTTIATSSTAVHLKWDSVNGAGSYQIQRKTASTSWKDIKSISATAIAYEDTSLTPSTTYYYRVRTTSGGFSTSYAPTNGVSVTTSSGTTTCTPDCNTAVTGKICSAYGTCVCTGSKPYSCNGICQATACSTTITAPTGLTATALSISQINLLWNDNSANEAGFKVERVKVSASTTTCPTTGYTTVATLEANSVSHGDSGLTAGTKYCYRIVAYTSSSSATSTAVIASTKSALSVIVSQTVGGSITYVPGALVSIKKSGSTTAIEKTTDSSGVAAFSDLGIGTYSVVVSKTNYVSSTSSTEVTENSNTITRVSLAPSSTTPAAPVLVSATAGNGKVTLRWNSVSSATSYRGYWKSGTQLYDYNSSSTRTWVVSAPTTIKEITGLTNNVKYYFIMKAYNANTNAYSELSDEVSTTPATTCSPNNKACGERVCGSVENGSCGIISCGPCTGVGKTCTKGLCVIIGGGCNYSQLPVGFIPVVGFYHQFGGGRIVLWDAGGQLYICNGSVWSNQTRSQASVGLPNSFKPTVGYYFNFNGTARINLFNSTGGLYVYNRTNWIYVTDKSKVSIGLSASFKPTVGYYHEFGNGWLNLFNSTGGLYVYNRTNWMDKTGSQASLGLPASFKPTVGYYFNYTNRTGAYKINLWDSSGSLYIYNGTYWLNKTADLKSLGLPTNKAPISGYFDDFKQEVILWYSESEAYSSSIGTKFEKIVLSSSENPPLTTDLGSIYMIVRENKTAVGGSVLAFLRDATVSISGPISNSNKTTLGGLVRFRNIPIGTYNITASKTGYVSATIKKQVLKDKTTTATLTLLAVNLCIPNNTACVGKVCGNVTNGSCGIISCGNCTDGKTCSNGVCVQPNFWCIDSDASLEGGIIFYTLGNVNYSTDRINQIIKTDVCLDNKTSVDFYCNDGIIANKTHTCLNGCNNTGTEICTPPMREICKDSDNGKTYDTKGEVNYTLDTESIISEDNCDDSETVKEFYCENNISKIKFHDCGSEMVCSDGRCKERDVSACPLGQIRCSDGLCHPSCGDGAECADDSNCDDGKKCINFACVTVIEGCTDNSDCNAGEVCNEEGICVNAVQTCSDNSECDEKEGGVCSDGTCTYPSVTPWTWIILIIVLALLITGIIGYMVYISIKKNKPKSEKSGGASGASISSSRPTGPGSPLDKSISSMFSRPVK